MFFSHDFSMIFQCFCYVFPIEQTAVVCGGGAFRVSCGALDHGAGPEKPTIKVTWSPKRWEWTSVYSTVYNIILYIYIDIVFSHFCWKLPLYFGSKVVTPCAKESLRKDQLLPALQHVRDGSKWPPHLGSKAVNVWNSKLED
jgi:hypothetical protein